METVVGDFWKNKTVFLTGHTGFKGAWLSLWLTKLGAKVVGYSLNPPTDPSLYSLCKLDQLYHSIIGDIRDLEKLTKSIIDHRPEIVIHMAAQPLVRYSYSNPIETYTTNVMGTVNLFEAIRKSNSVKAVVNVTTDKCYENNEWHWGYREQDALGGFDPYSNSKACSELVTSAYRNSYFNLNDYQSHGVAIATARAGNVIGGGDWALDRLIPDCMNSLLKDETILIRNPQSIRPWQHVLEPLNGYLMLAQKLFEFGPQFAQAWNFGPEDDDVNTVKYIVEQMCFKWNGKINYKIDDAPQPHEATYLKLDCSKAKALIGWKPIWNLDKALDSIIEWNKEYKAGIDIGKICLDQIDLFEQEKSKLGT
ncbi:CDP-glucose 4,6-dehydratase [Paenibacillus elgii]|uniref:CDP-glucose 4,6-dehydratase n=1 Tax=Paenibacillus elgii TaxID=189691 RepID=A0A2T6G6X0_9BACL|nr:CDP-glucose 4,6-dehydratase [Paenibacillus elgii]PUA39898.1 CDP-glucose 4,6-dehydratase [Paenibacillus elgii]